MEDHDSGVWPSIPTGNPRVMGMSVNSMGDFEPLRSTEEGHLLMVLTPEKAAQIDRIEAKIDQLLEKKKSKPRKPRQKIDYWTIFEDAWRAYPKRQGGNPKGKAFSAYKTRLYQDGAISGDNNWIRACHAGVERYAEYCDATGKTNTEYVMHAATFFGPEKHYLNDWHYDKRLKLPKNNEELVKFAADNGLPVPYEGQATESWEVYRRRLERHIMEQQ